MYREVMSETDREHLLTNIIGHASHGPGLEPEWRPVSASTGAIDPDLGAMVVKALGNGG